MEHLQAILKEFDPVAAPNKETLIRYFWDGLCLSIWAQVDNREQDLNAWKEVVEKAVNAEAKAGLQPHSMIREINSRCPKKHRPSIKKDKNDAYWEHRNEVFKDKKKAKSHLSSSANQPQTQASKKKQASWKSARLFSHLGERNWSSKKGQRQSQGPELYQVLHL